MKARVIPSAALTAKDLRAEYYVDPTRSIDIAMERAKKTKAKAEATLERLEREREEMIRVDRWWLDA